MKFPLAVPKTLLLGALALALVGGVRAQNPGSFSSNGYQPPADARERLGKIVDLLPSATPINRRYTGLKKMFQLPGGALFMDSALQTDADGSPRYREIDPDAGQSDTSLSFDGEEGQRQWVDAEKVPYIVLPLHFYRNMGIQLGDVAAVVWQGRVAYAVFADEGPDNLMGEGSIALHEQLGFDPWEIKNGTRQIVNGMDDGVVVIVFPNSAPKDLTPENINEKVAEIARTKFAELGGKVD